MLEHPAGSHGITTCPSNKVPVAPAMTSPSVTSPSVRSDNVHTRAIAEFVSHLTYEGIPAEVRERIKLLILDSLGCAIYGAGLEWCRILRDTLDALDASQHDLGLGHRRKTILAARGTGQRHASARFRA